VRDGSERFAWIEPVREGYLKANSDSTITHPLTKFQELAVKQDGIKTSSTSSE
jgi:hypothetical protein